VPFVEVAGGAIDYVILPGSRDDAGPPLVFLHEGLGSIELWRGFPRAVAEATGRRALVYSRHGHGRSATVAGRSRSPAYMHDEALTVLPELLDRLVIERPLLVGHSDGASIALIYTGAGRGPVSGLVLLAPHVFVEDRSVEGIEAARVSYLTTDLPARMARYHDDADVTFWGWNDVWLSPEFRSWNIEAHLPGVRCPVLLVQGEDDEYGTLAQLDAIERQVARGRVERLVLPECRHAPHLDRPTETTAAVVAFVEQETS
jgi:pimeloyl-ACP methyl ester carboxylesterase